jgi:tellurite resistance protein TerC
MLKIMDSHLLSPFTNWIFFGSVIVIMLGLDLCVFHRKSTQPSLLRATFLSLFWIVLALCFSVYVYWIKGTEGALNFLTGYLIEELLSIDNLFVFVMIFDYFKTPKEAYHKVLFWGVLGAIFMRIILLILGLSLIQKFHWITYLLGGFLIYTGIKFGLLKDKKIEPEKSVILKLFRLAFPVHSTYERNSFFIKDKGKWLATLLFVVLICVETTDLIFAFDSIPAILAISDDPFIVCTSNIFAVLGLRALFFVLAHLIALFHYLNYGLAGILVLIGLKMLFAHFVHIPIFLVLASVLLILIGAMFLSWRFPKNKKLN